MLVWVLGANPSKDTFWTTDNQGVDSKALGGCPANGCPVDHSNATAPLHTMLALLSTGPVGFSDAVGQVSGLY
jgi:hypothetical protein